MGISCATGELGLVNTVVGFPTPGHNQSLHQATPREAMGGSRPYFGNLEQLNEQTDTVDSEYTYLGPNTVIVVVMGEEPSRWEVLVACR